MKFLLTLPVFCAALCAFSAPARWAVPESAFRFPVTVKVPAPGKFIVPLDKAAVIKGVNALEKFGFKNENFACPAVTLVLDGKAIPGGFVILPGKELVRNGRFSQLKADGKPDQWSFSSAAAIPKFTVAENPDGRGNTVSASGADRHAMFQRVAIKPETWYRFVSEFKGIARPQVQGALYNIRSATAFPAGHTDIFTGTDSLNRADYFFYSGDRANWCSEVFTVSIMNFPTEVHSVSLQECRTAFVAEFPAAGEFGGHWYYDPLEGRHGHAPARIVSELPAAEIQAVITGKAEKLDSTRILASGDSGIFWSAPTTMKVTPDAVPGGNRGALKLFAAKNESETLQIVFTPARDGKLDSFTARIDGIPAECLSFLSPQYVKIAAPSSYAAGRMIIPHRSTFTGLLPDPMPEFAPTAVKKGENQLLWLDIAVPKTAAAGIHRGTVTITVDGKVTELPVELQVANFTLPDKPSFRTMFAFSQYANLRLFPFHGITSRADKYAISRKYIAEMAKYKINVKLPTAAGIYNPGKAVNANTASGLIDLYKTEVPWALGKIGLRHYLVSHFSGRSRHTAESAEKSAKHMDFIACELEKAGLLDGAAAWVDEPMISEYKYVKILRNAWQKTQYAKKIPFITATYHEYAYTQLRGLTDIVAILISDSNGVSKSGRKAWGNRPLWTYLTRSSALWIDAPGLDNRFMALRNWASDSEGMLIWGTNCWWSSAKSPHKQYNPWENPASTWGNGALAFFYPPIRSGSKAEKTDMRVTPSLRLILYRDGIEDFEYAAILADLSKNPKLSPAEKVRADELLARLRGLFPTPASWSLNDRYFSDLRLAVGKFISHCQAK